VIRFVTALLFMLAFLPDLSLFAEQDEGSDDEAKVTRMTPELLWKLGRVGNAALSSDGQLVAYTVKRYDLKENSGTSTLYVRHVSSGSVRSLVTDWKSLADVQFAASPFGQRIYITGTPGKDEHAKPQAWAVNPLDGGIYQVTDVEDGLANLKVDPTGKRLAFTVDIKLDDEVSELYEDLPDADARIIDSLMFRHWNQWHDYKYSHLHVAELDDQGRAKQATDLMKDRRVDCPVPPFGGSEQFAWAPDGSQIAYTLKDVEDWAESTNSDVYIVDLEDPAKAKNISEAMEGYDNNPVYSPDGRFLAFHSMARPSFESDRNRIMIFDRASGQISEATAGLDQTAHATTWAPDGEQLYFTSEHEGTVQVYRVPRTGGGSADQVSEGRFNWGLHGIHPDGTKMLVSFMSMLRPDELAILDLSNGNSETISNVNDEVYEDLELPEVEQRWVEATDGQKIHCWVILPPGFDRNKKWPMLTYCQGGPQGQIGQWFSFRWNFHLMAANGYVVLAPNRRGLPGFGRAWNDQISGDWGGQAMKDILSATDAMLDEDFIDKKHVGAIGASFGGYTVYWLMGHHKDRFACMIAHCGVFNLESMYGSTEELFFVNWDLGGPYWESPKTQRDYNRFSPHRFVKNWKTPLLVVHGQKDFRVPVTQGIEAFTAAQVQRVPSRFLYFPDEGHWVQGPQNGVLWHRIFFDWLDRYCKESKPAAKKAG
jgi:dipeptidyl aminopeptidase/acylaminoacyl peptidase